MAPASELQWLTLEIVARRPQNDRERDQRTPSVVRCDPALSEIHVNQHPSAKKRGKTYTFDNVFGQYAEQKEVYSTLVRPIVNEVLDGFNCTVFAYGQTGCVPAPPKSANRPRECGF